MIKHKEKVFRFKQFSVGHDRCAMKVGTDAVLLGAWVDITCAKRILDIGTGSGVIALMLAQRTGDKVLIDAIEIEPQDFMQAAENVLQSPWPRKISVIQSSLQEFCPEHQFDLVVCNPPYFNNSLLPPSRHRANARHTETLSYEDLILHSIRLLSTKGKLAVVLPVGDGNRFKSIANEKGFHVIRQLAFYSRKEKPQERWLFEFGFKQTSLKEEKIVLYESGNEKSLAYINLTKDFYL